MSRKPNIVELRKELNGKRAISDIAIYLVENHIVFDQNKEAVINIVYGNEDCFNKRYESLRSFLNDFRNNYNGPICGLIGIRGNVQENSFNIALNDASAMTTVKSALFWRLKGRQVIKAIKKGSNKIVSFVWSEKIMAPILIYFILHFLVAWVPSMIDNHAKAPVNIVGRAK
jgi:hypothetical protein